MSLDGWKRASFLVASESNVSNVKQWEPLPGGSVRPSGPCCFAVARAPFVSLDGWKRASFLVGSSSRQGSQTAPSPQQNSRALKDGPSLRATAPKLALFQPSRLTNGASATAKQQGPEGRTEPPGNGSHCLTLLSEPTRKLESNVRQWEPLPGGSVRPSGPCCFAQWEICPGVGGRGRSPLICGYDER